MKYTSLYLNPIMMAEEVLIVGHSQTKYFSRYIDDPTITTLPFPGYKFNELWKEIKDYVLKFKVIAIHCGINDLSRTEADEVVARLETLLGDIWYVNPTAEIILSSVLPRSQNMFPGRERSQGFLFHVNRRITEFNAKLYDICRSHKQLHFVSHPNFVEMDMLSKDGLHLSHAGTADLVKDIVASINYVRCYKLVMERQVSVSW